MKKLKFMLLWLYELFLPKKPVILEFPELENIPVTYKDISEDVKSDICVANTKERLNSVGITNHESEEAVLYLSKDKISSTDIEFEKKVIGDLNAKEKKRRILIYRLESTSGAILFEGKHLKKFLATTKLILPFNYKSAYRFANKHQDEKVFRDKYFISFKEKIN